MLIFEKTNVLYENPLTCLEDLREFRVEGDASITFPRGRMRMENASERDKEHGVHANFILWCERDFPDNVAVSWDFRCMLLFPLGKPQSCKVVYLTP